MRYVRFLWNDTPTYGKLVDETTIQPLAGDLFDTPTESGDPIALADVALLAPVIPRYVYAIGLNYAKHIEEFRHIDATRVVPEAPIAFMVAPSAIIGPNTPIVLQNHEHKIDYEAELVVVIGRTCYQVDEASALDYVFGYTCGNDVSDRNHQNMDKQWLRAKSHPTYKPLGPWIETDLAPQAQQVRSYVNGALRQDGHSGDMIFSVAQLIAHLSSFTPLYPGDLIYTGTPDGVGALQEGDAVDIEISGIGRLHNPVLTRH